MSNLIVRAVPAGQTGVASGMNANIRTIGGAVGAGVMSSIVTSQDVGVGCARRVGLHPRLHLPRRLHGCSRSFAAIFIPTVAPDHEPTSITPSWRSSPAAPSPRAEPSLVRAVRGVTRAGGSDREAGRQDRPGCDEIRGDAVRAR